MYEELQLHYKEKKLDFLAKQLVNETNRQKQFCLADRINQTQIEIDCILYKLKEH